jgi:hypothetical protein
MALPLFLAAAYRLGGAKLLQKVITSKLGKDITDKTRNILLKQLAKLRRLKDRRKTDKAPYKKPQSDKDILLRINRDKLARRPDGRLKTGEGIVVPKHLKKAWHGGGRVKKSKKESRPLKKTTADKAFDTVAGVGLAATSINAAVEEGRKPKKDRATWSKHETSVMKKNRKAKEEKARKIKEEREK